ncbi:MAG: FMN-binding glutamate synthase family protein [Acidobacteria bacterium]|nr:MAG: FMN-binding glutamate synthase family protein [Acidobacteriota bacterium]
MTSWFLWGVLGFLALVVIYDLVQKKHAILRNFPIIGHLRYMLEAVGPELRQYIVTNNDEERPFSRDQRRWVYASAKGQNNYFGFGTDNDLELRSNYLIVKHSAFPLLDPHPGEPGYDPQYRIPCAKVLGAWRGRAKAFRPRSVVNVSGMSYGSLSAAAVEALNRGAALAGCLHNTGEGGIARHHRHGGELIWQIGTGYFGCRDPQTGGFSRERFLETVAATPNLKAIEIKLSQGAKPGLGGVLPAAKVTPEIAAIRGIPLGRDCISPARHTAFDDVDGMLDFIELLADLTGLPVGIKSAVGELDFWQRLAARITSTGKSPDFITIDGGEGGTGAAPLSFSDHVALPFKLGFARVYRVFAEAALTDRIVFVGSGKLGFPETGLLAFTLGCDLINVGREAMLAIGCIQAQRCHTGHCPTGVATQNRWLMHGLDPSSKAARLANYVTIMRKELLRLSRACGVAHPACVTADHMEILDDQFAGHPVRDVFGYHPDWGVPSAADCAAVVKLMQGGSEGPGGGAAVEGEDGTAEA